MLLGKYIKINAVTSEGYDMARQGYRYKVDYSTVGTELKQATIVLNQYSKTKDEDLCTGENLYSELARHIGFKETIVDYYIYKRISKTIFPMLKRLTMINTITKEEAEQYPITELAAKELVKVLFSLTFSGKEISAEVTPEGEIALQNYTNSLTDEEKIALNAAVSDLVGKE